MSHIFVTNNLYLIGKGNGTQLLSFFFFSYTFLTLNNVTYQKTVKFSFYFLAASNPPSTSSVFLFGRQAKLQQLGLTLGSAVLVTGPLVLGERFQRLVDEGHVAIVDVEAEEAQLGRRV